MKIKSNIIAKQFLTHEEIIFCVNVIRIRVHATCKKEQTLYTSARVNGV